MNDYNFFLFSLLLNDVIINTNMIYIPYDTLFDIINNLYTDYLNEADNHVIGTYESMLNFINKPYILEELMKYNDFK